jgi:hypothetical protein
MSRKCCVGYQIMGNTSFQILTTIFFVNLMATISLWRAAARKPSKPKRKLIRQLLHRTPITHRPPKAIEISSRLDEKDRQFFRDFAGFALLLNRWFDGEDVKSPFRLQELPDIEIQLEGLHTPIYGWRYAIFYNQARLGTLEIWPEHHYTAENPNVHTTIRLGGLRLLPFNTIREFLNTLAMYVCESDQDSKNLQTDIDSALTGVLWQTQQFGAGGEDWGELNLHLNGSASAYVVQIKRVLHEPRTKDAQTDASGNYQQQPSFRNGDFPIGTTFYQTGVIRVAVLPDRSVVAEHSGREKWFRSPEEYRKQESAA